MNMIEFAKSELERLENSCDKDDVEAINLQKQVTSDVLAIVDLFVAQKHSGFSANYILNIIERLLRYKPLTAIEDKPDDWIDCSQFGLDVKQHKRCGEVFKRPDGTFYWVNGKIFSDDNGKSWYTSRDSIVDITMPFNVPLYSENVYVEPESDVQEEDNHESK